MVFHPTIARNLIDNRLFQLPAYRLNAKAFGLKGAYVPWEVGYSGGFARDDLVNHREVVSAAAPFASSFEAQSSGCTGGRMAQWRVLRGAAPTTWR